MAGTGACDSAEILDLRAGTAVRTGPMQRPRDKHADTSVVLADGRVLIAGGAWQAASTRWGNIEPHDRGRTGD